MHLFKSFLNESFLTLSLPEVGFKFFSNKTLNEFFEHSIVNEVAIDSRSVKPNQMFVALEGEKVDAHNFLQDVLQKGVSVLLINKKKEKILKLIDKKLLQEKLFILVDDTLSALIELAKNWRKQFDFPIVGITGSIGKTTTKGMVESILQFAKIPACVAFKNQNTTIGLSLNILKLSHEHKVGVFELGIDAAGEMDELADILRPDIALITRVSLSHALGLGTLLDIAKEKRKIFKHFKPDNYGMVFGDQPLLENFYRDFPLIRFGLKTKNQIQARRIKIINTDPDNYEFKVSFNLKVYKAIKTVRINGNNRGFVYNALAAATIANFLEINIDNIVGGLENFSSVENRFEKKYLKDNKGIIISDCYNANPESMKSAVSAFGQVETKNLKIAVLGDMLELGPREIFWHKNLGRFLHKSGDIDYLILVGSRAKHIAKTSPLNFKTECVLNWKQAKKHLESILKSNTKSKSMVLVKGSRGMSLDNLVREFSV